MDFDDGFQEKKEMIGTLITVAQIIGIVVFALLVITYFVKLFKYNGIIKKAKEENDEETLKKYTNKKTDINTARNTIVIAIVLMFIAPFFLKAIGRYPVEHHDTAFPKNSIVNQVK